jgi:hypothetical protein
MTIVRRDYCNAIQWQTAFDFLFNSRLLFSATLLRDRKEMVRVLHDQKAFSCPYSGGTQLSPVASRWIVASLHGRIQISAPDGSWYCQFGYSW